MEYKKLFITGLTITVLLFYTGAIQAAQKQEVASEILRLPVELLNRIFSYLDKKTLYDALYVNKEFHCIAALCLPECLWQEEGRPAFLVARGDRHALITHPEDIQKAIFGDKSFWGLAHEKEIDPQQLPHKTPFFRALFSSRIPDDVFDELCGNKEEKADDIEIDFENTTEITIQLENNNDKKIRLSYTELLKKFGYKVARHCTPSCLIDDILECLSIHITSIISENNPTEICSLVDFDCHRLRPVNGALVIGFCESTPDSFMKWFTAEIPSKKLWYIRVKNWSDHYIGDQLSPRDVQVTVFEKFFRKCYLPDGLCLVVDAVRAPDSSIANLVTYKNLVCDIVAQWTMESRAFLVSPARKVVSPKKVTPIIWKHKDDLRAQFYESFEDYNNDDAYYTYQPMFSRFTRKIPCEKIVAMIFQWHPDLQKINQIFCTEPFTRCNKEETKQVLRSFIDDASIKKADTFVKIISFLQNHRDVNEHTIEDGLKKYSKIIFDDEIDRLFWDGYQSHKASYVTLFKNIC